MVGLSVPDGDAPIELDAADLMSTPPGQIRVGDEFRTAANHISCVRCRALSRKSSTHCFGCGRVLQ